LEIIMLTRLTVRNFKRFDSIEIELGNPVVFSGGSEGAPTIDNLLKGYADSITAYSGRISVQDEESPTFFKEITKGLQQHPNIQAQAEKCLPWAEKIGKERIDGIVSNKYRKAYGRAAKTMCSLAETRIVMGNVKKAQTLLRRYYHEKYNRHSAFRREVKGVVAVSAPLQELGFL
jgi:site-specific DNA-cytosine methylase